ILFLVAGVLYIARNIKLIIMATQKDLDAAIDNLLSVIQSKAAQVATDLQNLEAKIAQAAPEADFSDEIAKIKKGVDAIGDIDPTAAQAPAPTTNTDAAAQVNPPPPVPAEITPPVNPAPTPAPIDGTEPVGATPLPSNP